MSSFHSFLIVLPRTVTDRQDPSPKYTSAVRFPFIVSCRTCSNFPSGSISTMEKIPSKTRKQILWSAEFEGTKKDVRRKGKGEPIPLCLNDPKNFLEISVGKKKLVVVVEIIKENDYTGEDEGVFLVLGN